jgi:hypothetical protein
MPKLHLKRIIISLAIGSFIGFQSGWNSHKTAMDNPLFKIATEWKLF